MKAKLTDSQILKRRTESVQSISPIRRHSGTGILPKKETKFIREQG